MTKNEFLAKLNIIADMGDKQIETLANTLIEYFDTTEEIKGFVEKK